MIPEIKLVISCNDKVIQAVNKPVQDQRFVKAIEEFQKLANTTMTNLIEESGDSGDCIMEEDSDECDSSDDEDITTPKKKKK